MLSQRRMDLERMRNNGPEEECIQGERQWMREGGRDQAKYCTQAHLLGGGCSLAQGPQGWGYTRLKVSFSQRGKKTELFLSGFSATFTVFPLHI